MITDEIQELLDGGLGDERTAELLHTLSVSPEKRHAFRQHLGLRAAIQNDRLASAITPDEDAAMWGAISGTAAMPTASASRSWLRRGAALVTAGVIGYILGTTSIFTGPDTVAPAPGRAAEHAAPQLRQPAPSVASAGNQTAVAPRIEYRDRPVFKDRVVYKDRIAYKDRVVYQDRVVYKDRVVYQDRVVYRDAAEGQADPSGAVSLTETNLSEPKSTQTATDTPAASSATSTQASTTSGAGALADTAGAGTATSARGTTPVITPDSSAKSRPSAIADGSMPQDAATPSGASSATSNVQGGRNEDLIAMLGGDEASPIDKGGWEGVYVERLGLLAPAPQKIDAKDPGYSYRLLGLTHWFEGGRFGFGVRGGYGSFASVELERRESSTGLGEEIGATVTSKERVWFEGLLAWRHPVTRNLAISAEASVGGSTHHTKVGGDIVATYFVTDFLGLQAGAGVGRYWYSIAGARDEMLGDTQTGGVVSEAGTNYEGLTFEGRYGLFIRF